jgi:hypothetical protein
MTTQFPLPPCPPPPAPAKPAPVPASFSDPVRIPRRIVHAFACNGAVCALDEDGVLWKNYGTKWWYQYPSLRDKVYEVTQ